MRRLLAVFTVAAMALVVTGMAQAATFDPGQSQLQTSLGGINNPPLTALEAGGGGSISLVDNGAGGHDIVIDASVWATVNHLFGSALYTGVPVIDDIGVTIINNAFTATSNFTALNYLTNQPHPVIGPRLGGQGALTGTLILWMFGNPAVSFPLNVVGGPAGGTFTTTVLGIPFSNTYEPWFTGGIPISGITTNIMTYNGVTGAAMTMRLEPGQGKVLSTGGGFVTTSGGLPLEYHTVTPSGPNNLLSATSTATGSVTLVTPYRLNTSPVVSGRIPGATWMDLVFVPEPGTLLLLVTGAVGLVAIGRRRARK